MHSLKSFVHITLSAALIMLCVSCGVSGGGGGGGASPTSSHSPAADDPTQNYFSFQTEAAANYAEYGNGYKGVAVYYKIYTSAANITNHYSTIAAETTGIGGKNKLESDSLGYKLLNGAEYIIPFSQTNQSVEIRLFDETAYTKGIKVDGTVLTSPPTRSVSGKTFQFSSTEYPRTGEGDFNGTETSTGPWYVAAYAVSVSQAISTTTKTTTVTEYSKPKYLGYIKIYY